MLIGNGIHVNKMLNDEHCFFFALFVFSKFVFGNSKLNLSLSNHISAPLVGNIQFSPLK